MPKEMFEMKVLRFCASEPLCTTLHSVRMPNVNDVYFMGPYDIICDILFARNRCENDCIGWEKPQ